MAKKLSILILAMVLPIPSGFSQDNTSGDEIEQLIKQLGASTLKEREQATQKLYASGKPALSRLQNAAKSGNPEVKARAEILLEALAVRDRLAFSEDLMEALPSLCFDLARCADGRARFDVLQKILERDDKHQPIHPFAERDIAAMIHEILNRDRKGLLSTHLEALCFIARGGSSSSPFLGIQIASRIKIPSAEPDFRALLKDKNPGVRGQAAETLGEVGGKDSIPDLRNLLQDQDSYVLIRAMIALEKLRAFEAIEDIKKVAHRDKAVADHAQLTVETLTKLQKEQQDQGTDQRIEKTIRRLLESSDEKRSDMQNELAGYGRAARVLLRKSIEGSKDQKALETLRATLARMENPKDLNGEEKWDHIIRGRMEDAVGRPFMIKHIEKIEYALIQKYLPGYRFYVACLANEEEPEYLRGRLYILNTANADSTWYGFGAEEINLDKIINLFGREKIKAAENSQYTEIVKAVIRIYYFSPEGLPLNHFSKYAKAHDTVINPWSTEDFLALVERETGERTVIYRQWIIGKDHISGGNQYHFFDFDKSGILSAVRQETKPFANQKEADESFRRMKSPREK